MRGIAVSDVVKDDGCLGSLGIRVASSISVFCRIVEGFFGKGTGQWRGGKVNVGSAGAPA